jgi:hypothetical protein
MLFFQDPDYLLQKVVDYSNSYKPLFAYSPFSLRQGLSSTKTPEHVRPTECPGISYYPSEGLLGKERVVAVKSYG